MLFRTRSSRRRYAEYRERQRDPRWSSMDTLEALGRRGPRPRRGRSFGTLFAALWGMLCGHRVTVIAALGTLTAATVIGLAIPSSTKIAIDYILLDTPGPTGLPEWARRLAGFDVAGDHAGARTTLLVWLGAAMLALAAVSIVVGIWGRFQITRITKRLQASMRRAAFDHASALPLDRVYGLKSGGLVSLLREDAGSAAELLFTLIYNPWRAVVQLVGTLVVLTFVDWRMLMGGLLIIPATWLTHRTWINRIRPVFRDIKVTRMANDAHATEAFGGMRIVRGFSRRATESLRFTSANHLMSRQELLVWWWSRALEMIWAFLIPLASVAVLVYGGSRVIGGTLTIGDVMMFSTYVLMLLSPMETLTNTAANVQTNLAGFDRVLDLLEEPTEFGGRRGGVQVSRATSRGHVELRAVSFAYPARGAEKQAPASHDADTHPRETRTPETMPQEPKPQEPKPTEPVLRGVSLLAEPGRTVALVGPSGSGKTTLCNLIARFYDPTQGQILFDGVDLRDIDVESYRRLLGIVEQDVFLFDGTIAENIAYGRRSATMNDVREAARVAHADEFVRGMPAGYDTVIGERGVRLSGGQRQRLAIARAVLADPVVLILDEATSNLDAESEQLIRRSLTELMRGRTCFVIAHRLSTIRGADKIVVLDHGRVVETGTHEQLLASGGRYADLLRAQVESGSLDADRAAVATTARTNDQIAT